MGSGYDDDSNGAVGWWKKAEEMFGGRKTQGEREAEGRKRAASEAQYGETQGVTGRMTAAENEQLNQSRGNVEAAQGSRDAAINKHYDTLDQNTNDARNVYKDVSSRQRGMMDQSQREAKSAMTLKQAGDPNNAVQQSFRNMYNQEGQAARAQGMHDTGVMSALGAQATAQQMGGLPMTGAQLQSVYGQNQSQAGLAFSQAQQRMTNLRDQGISAGIEQSGLQYDRGQKAQDRARSDVQDYSQGARTHRGELEGLSGSRMDIGTGRAMQDLNFSEGLSGMQSANTMAQGQRDIQGIQEKYGQQRAQSQGDIDRVQARRDAANKVMQTGVRAAAAYGTGGASELGYAAKHQYENQEKQNKAAGDYGQGTGYGEGNYAYNPNYGKPYTPKGKPGAGGQGPEGFINDVEEVGGTNAEMSDNYPNYNRRNPYPRSYA